MGWVGNFVVVPKPGLPAHVAEEQRVGLRALASEHPATQSQLFGADGPLAWLHGRTPVASLHLGDFRLTFGA